jgi:uncharacterized protein (TIGR03086 family)
VRHGTSSVLDVIAVGDREIVMTRRFAAPRSLVFDALTTPELLLRWMHGPEGWRMVRCDVDPTVGGRYRYVWRGPNGERMTANGVFREITYPERLVTTEQFDDDWTGGEVVSVSELVADDGTTVLRHTATYTSRSARDAALESGMKHGVEASYAHLDDVLADHDRNADPMGADDNGTGVNDVLDRYLARADAFENKVAQVQPEQWNNPSPCDDWDARGVLQHCLDMHAAMLRPLGRSLSDTPPVDDDPLGAFRSARTSIEAVLRDQTLSRIRCDTPNGPMSAAAHIDAVASEDLVIHGWDLSRATDQDDAIDPREAERLWADLDAMPDDLLDKYRTPGAFGLGIVVYGPEVPVPADAPLQDRLLGRLGRDPGWTN